MTLKKFDFHNVSKILGILVNLGPLFDRRRLSLDPSFVPPSAQRESLEAKKRELGGKGGGKVVGGGIKLKSPPGKRLV